jgi:hypothetical protein
MHKMNVFHWHLTEDQGWRVEIKKYPNLIKIGSVRKETIIGRNDSSSYDGTPHGGYYTQEEIREVVKYAAERYIDIIPEIDMPGHMVAALASYNYLGCRDENFQVRTKWGISKDVLCIVVERCRGDEYKAQKHYGDIGEQCHHIHPAKERITTMSRRYVVLRNHKYKFSLNQSSLSRLLLLALSIILLLLSVV